MTPHIPRIFLVLFVATLLHGQDFKLPDPSNGIVDGKAALLYWPTALREDGDPGAQLALDGCQVHAVLFDDLERETSYPCGAWFVPPPDRYWMWLEQGDTISAGKVQTLATGNGTGGLPARFPMVPAGYVAAADNVTLDDHVAVRFLNLTPAYRAFLRSVAGSGAKKPVRVQAGRVAGGIFDRKSGDAVMLFHPQEVKAGQTLRFAAAAPPANSSDVFVVLKPPPAQYGKIGLALRAGEQTFPANEIVDGGWRIYAIWYSVPSGSATLEVSSPRLTYIGPPLVLRSGAVTTRRDELKLKPSVDVTVHIDSDRPPEMSIDVQRHGNAAPIRHIPIKNGETKRIEALDPEPWQILLRIESWKIQKPVDLSDGIDKTVAYELAPIDIHGAVRHGRDPAPAKISFLDFDGWIDVNTGDDGSYHTTLWTPRDYLTRVSLRAEPGDFMELKSIRESGLYDFDLPRTRYTVRVRSASDQRPLQGAKVTFENVWSSDPSGEQNVFLSTTTNEAGEALLPPLRQGTVAVNAEASGFEASDFRREAVESDGERIIEIALTPITESASLKLLFPNGAPAAGAELLATSEAGNEILWTGTSGEDGAIDVPAFLEGALLLVRHANGASIARVWSGKEQQWRMLPPASPLTIRVESPSRGGRVTAVLDGRRLSGMPLAFMTWSTTVVAPDGKWTARNLPPEPLRILVWRRADPNAVTAGAYDSLATQCDYPWSEPILVRAAD